MWADELWFGAFIEIWPVILMINTAERASFSESELILHVFHQNSVGCYEIPKQLLSVNWCFPSC